MDTLGNTNSLKPMSLSRHEPVVGALCNQRLLLVSIQDSWLSGVIGRYGIRSYASLHFEI